LRGDVRIKRFKLVITTMMLAFVILAGGSVYSDPGADAPDDAPLEVGASETTMSDDSKALASAPVDPQMGLAQEAETNASIEGSTMPIPEISSGETLPIPTLLNKEVWFEIENRSLDGSGPYGMLLVNLLPTGSPNFNRLLEEAGYSKVREFEEISGSCDWWDDPKSPTLPNRENGPDLGNETVQVKRFYVGWTYSKTYHYPDCIWAKNIPAGSQVWFSSPEEARAQGYVPCSTCKPP